MQTTADGGRRPPSWWPSNAAIFLWTRNVGCTKDEGHRRHALYKYLFRNEQFLTDVEHLFIRSAFADDSWRIVVKPPNVDLLANDMAFYAFDHVEETDEELREMYYKQAMEINDWFPDAYRAYQRETLQQTRALESAAMRNNAQISLVLMRKY